MLRFIFLFSTAALISLGLTPLIRLLAIKAKVLDYPSDRKVHLKPIPLLGGLSIFLAFNVTLVIGQILFAATLHKSIFLNWTALFISETLILGLGIIDDIKRLRPKTKLLVQAFIGVLMVVSGFGIESLTNPLNGKIIHLGVLGVPLTIIWVLGITNALNLVDGLDGLAAGTALIASVTILAISFIQHNATVVLLAVVLAGSLLGFLRYNFFPARIFLGDSGSLFLGFMLAVLSIRGSSKGATLVAVLAPIMALGLPIMDTLLSMLRRLLKSIPVSSNDEKSVFKRVFSMFEADKDHLHHRLLKLGYSHRNAVIILYVSCSILGVLAFLTVVLQNLNIVAFLIAVLIVMFVGIKNLNYQEFKILHNGLLLPLFQIPMVNKRSFLAFYDFCAIAMSYSLSYLLYIHAHDIPSKALFTKTIAFIILLKMSTFYWAGFYKGPWIRSNLQDALTILKIIFLSSLGASAGLVLIFGREAFGGVVFFILDFYFLLSFVIGFRIFYRIAYDLYNQSTTQKEKKILIYGAGNRGHTVVQDIQQNGSYIFAPIGFIDDDSKKTGQVLSGCPVLGTIEDLERIVTKNTVLEIIISTEKISKEKIRKLMEFCKQKRIILRQYAFRFYEFP